MNDNDTLAASTAPAAEPVLAAASPTSLRRRAEQLGLAIDPDAPLQELAEAVQQRLALLDRLDESAMREILAWARRPAPTEADREELLRRIAQVRKWNYHRLSHKAMLTLALLRDLPISQDTSADEILKALRSNESLRQRLRRKRRALAASLIGKIMGLHAAPPPSTATGARPSPPASPDLKEHIVERGIVRGLATTIRGVTDDYIRQKLDEIERRIDRKLDEIDQRLQEWRDREIANRLRIIKITLVASIVVAVLSFAYSWIQSHVVRPGADGTPAAVAPDSRGPAPSKGLAPPGQFTTTNKRQYQDKERVPMLRRLSPKSQQIVDEAQNIARRYEQEYVDTEHVLLAIAEKNDNRAAKALQQCGASAQKIRKNVEQIDKEHPETFVLGRLPATLHFRNVVARALEIAEKQGSPAVEPEHLLLSLTQEGDSLATRALQNLGIDTAKIEGVLAGKK